MDSGRVQFSRPPDATNSTQQGRRASAMRTVATITIAAVLISTDRHLNWALGLAGLDLGV